MIYGAMPAMPVSDLRNKQAEVISLLSQTPVMLTRKGRSAGILVHPDNWNKLVRDLEKYQRAARLKQLADEMDTDPSLSIPWETVQAGLIERGLIDA